MKSAPLPEVPVYHCRRTRRAPALDGRLDPKIWGRAEPANLRQTVTGEAPHQSTELRMLYDDRYLYIGFHCIDSDVWGGLTVRDDPVFSEEVVEAFIDAAGRGRMYFEIVVSPLNTVFDAFCTEDPRASRSQVMSGWTCHGFRSATYVHREEGRVCKYWNCEMAVPFDQMHDAPNIPPRPGDCWRINLYRIDRAAQREEYTAWSPTGVLNFHRAGRFGQLRFE